jgi:hypothetical protein
MFFRLQEGDSASHPEAALAGPNVMPQQKHRLSD